ncbi:hypothetical protein GYMLUDRAFT_945830 [Collybiopsis luxurians FD-317 M1]|uniref:Uncharacterized protein n=1 Tax=Collybiopsis luxurians FD-317 M1 TaxID=944289 RepID=A0A0D0ARJ5_9AGAR|nr:hypothetical protein GYMLUDRAFT_945830 [Collybiopsis luxurians FD-317 M1]
MSDHHDCCRSASDADKERSAMTSQKSATSRSFHPDALKRRPSTESLPLPPIHSSHSRRFTKVSEGFGGGRAI